MSAAAWRIAACRWRSPPRRSPGGVPRGETRTASRIPIASSPAVPGRWPSDKHRRDFLDEPAPHHLIGPPPDSRVQHRSRHREHNVPRSNRTSLTRLPLPVRQRATGEERHLDRARRTLASTTPKPGVEPPGPPHQLERLEPRHIGIEPPPARDDRAPARGTALRPARGRTVRCRPRSPASCRSRFTVSIQAAASRAKWPALYRVPGSTTSTPWCGTLACSFRVGLAVPMSRRRYTCRESAEMTSSGQCAASASATAVFPTAVGPTSTGMLSPSKPALQLLERQLHDRRAAVDVVRRQLGREEPEHQLAHLASGRADRRPLPRPGRQRSRRSARDHWPIHRTARARDRRRPLENRRRHRNAGEVSARRAAPPTFRRMPRPRIRPARAPRRAARRPRAPRRSAPG